MAKKKIRKSKAKKVKKSKKKTMKKKAKKTKKSRTKKAARKVKKSKKKAKKAPKGKKKAMRKPGRVKASAKAAGTLGKVIHYYDKIGVGIVKMAGSLRVGESVVFKRGPEEFAQQVTSMEVDHTPVNEAKKGQIIGLKVNQPVKDGAVVMKA